MIIIKKIISLGLLLLIASSTSLAAQEQELLPPEEAFHLTARVEANSLVAEYRIAEGYYMYRERFEFEIEPGDSSVSLGSVMIPRGKIKEDEFFGKMETYRQQVKVTLPLLFDGSPPTSIKLKVTSQGCADIGVCYPPQKQLLSADLSPAGQVKVSQWRKSKPASAGINSDVAALQAMLSEVNTNLENNQSAEAAELGGSSDALAVLQALGQDLGLDNEDEILHPDEAFILSARLDANNIIQTNILMGDNIYLYRDKIKIKLVEGNNHSLGAISVPRGKQKNDEFLGLTEVIYDQVDVAIPVISGANASNQLTLSYQYQGCVEDRICYPPITKYLDIDAGQGLIRVVNDLTQTGASALSATATGTASPVTVPDSISEQDQFAQLLQGESLLLIVGLFFLAGVGLTFTPCVFPMIPILSSIIAGQGESITTRKAFVLSLVYVLSMATTYAVAGAIVGYYGAEFNIQIWFQNPVVLSIFAGIFVLLSLSMFGFYELQMPNAIQSRLTAISNNQQGGKLVGVGLMGLFSAIIVGPCITAPLVGALIFISQTQDWQLGGLALFALGLGMGAPLMLIGTSAGKLLPRAGGWMDSVKAAFGVVLIAVAIWLLERILPVGITMALVAALLIASAIYMGALDSLGEAATGWRKFFKAIGLLVLIYGIAYLIGAAAGSKDLIQPLKGLSGGYSNAGQATAQHVVFQPVKGQEGLQLALGQSVNSGRPVMLDFYADWCISCKEMEKYAFTHPRVLAALDQVSTLQADVTDNDAADTGLMASLGIYGPPAILFFDRNGEEIRHRRVVGEMSGDQFADHVEATFQ